MLVVVVAIIVFICVIVVVILIHLLLIYLSLLLLSIGIAIVIVINIITIVPVVVVIIVAVSSSSCCCFYFLICMSLFLQLFNFKLEKEEINFVRRIVCVLNMTGHLLKRIHTYRCVSVHWMTILLFVRGVEVRVTSIQLKAIPCTSSVSLDGHHVLFPLILIWYHCLDLEYNNFSQLSTFNSLLVHLLFTFVWCDTLTTSLCISIISIGMKEGKKAKDKK